MNYNENHYKKAYDSIAYKDIIYNKLTYNTIWDKILNSTLQKEDCTHEEFYNFLKLLK